MTDPVKIQTDTITADVVFDTEPVALPLLGVEWAVRIVDGVPTVVVFGADNVPKND